MGSIRNSSTAQKSKPEIDDTLAEIMIGYHFLSDTRGLVLGMSGGVQMPLILTEMIAYYDTFKPRVSKTHFIRVVNSADSEFIRLQSDKQARKNKSKGSGGSNTFPKLPVKG